MRFLSIVTLLALVSCGGSEAPSNNIGTTRRYEPIAVSIGDAQRIQMVCNALSAKQDQINVLANSSYTFSYSEKNCGEETMTESKDVVTRIHRSGSDYFFKKADGNNFAFADIETSSSGALAEVCGNLNSLMSPVQTSSTGAIWYTANANSGECQTDASHVCVLIEKGTVADGMDYTIHTTEWIRFSVGALRRGFFTEREMISSASCKNGKTLTRKASLK